eukprot:908300-Alexandrium_andersonii.AAC.1
MALTVERQETLSTAMAGVVAPYYDVRNEQRPHRGLLPAVSAGAGGAAHGARGERGLLAAAAEQRRLGGVGPGQSMAAGAHFRAQDD